MARWTRKRLPSWAPVPKTDELRLAAALTEPGSSVLDVEIRWSSALDSRADAWSKHEIRVGTHWLDAAGSTLVVDGPRSEPVDFQWLRLTPQRRLIRIGAAPKGAAELQVELVAEGLAWGTDDGLSPLRFHSGPHVHLVPAPASQLTNGPEAPSEPPSDTREWLAAAWPADAPEAEMANYVGADLARFLMSVQLMPEEPGDVLEIGSNPYFISRLIQRRWPDVHLAMTNYFGEPGNEVTQDVVDAQGRVVSTFRSALINTEVEPLPYEDASLDTVLLCEVIEHMVEDPAFQLAEIARVMRPGGTFILTTPNVARAANLRRLSQRQGIYDPYSGYGPHGRHNREYTACELFELVEAIGFTPVKYLTRPVHTVPNPTTEWFAASDDDGSGDYHFLVLERRAGPVVHARPAWLYR